VPGRCPGQRGVTLLELLVMLVVLGLLMATLTQGIRLGLLSSKIAAHIQDGTAELETTARVLRQLIARASPGDPAAIEGAFAGTPHTALFVTTLPDGFRAFAKNEAFATNEAEVSLGVADHHLELRWRPHYRRWIESPPPPNGIPLLDGVERLDLSFWRPGSGSGPGSWVQAWSGRGMPGLVRVRVVFPPGDARRWPDIVVAPMRELPRP
jgi:general secretion pathway protein J